MIGLLFNQTNCGGGVVHLSTSPLNFMVAVGSITLIIASNPQTGVGREIEIFDSP